ncbi:hypothetical protein BDQ17DRAFT_1325625 [Cyathus striatus]|nr:hypothetical protein BDQ17DRAFT_1325625 [Cyathus striatus]
MPSTSQQACSLQRSPSPSVEYSLTESVTCSPTKLVKVARHLELQRNEAQVEIQALQHKLADVSNCEEDSDSEAPLRKHCKAADSENEDGISANLEDQEQELSESAMTPKQTKLSGLKTLTTRFKDKFMKSGWYWGIWQKECCPRNGLERVSYSSVDVEILHKDYKGSFDYDMIFLNPILMRAQWTLSADQCLQSTGVMTGINYAKDLDEYLEILTKGLQKRKKGIIEVFAEWNRVVFPNLPSSLADRHRHQDLSSSGLKNALDMMEADDVEESDPEDE